MRFLFVHDRFGALGGAEANLLATAVEFQQRGHEVGLVHGPRTSRSEIEWHETFTRRWSLGVAHPAVVLGRAVNAFEPDVIYIHNIPDLAVTEALAETGAPLVRMVHDHHLFCLRGCKYHYLSRKICTRALSPYCLFPCGGSIRRTRAGWLPIRWISYSDKKREMDCHRQFQRLIVASQYMKDELVNNQFDPERIVILPPVPRNGEAGLEPSFSERNLIVYAGQIVRGKGVDVLLEALSLVRMPFECVILGNGSHRPACERLARKLGLSNRVRFPGFVPQDRIQDFYREAALAVLSSVWPEPFGAVGLEAMRCGLPVVAFDAGGIREWLSDGVNGFLVPWMDRVQFAARVETLLRNKPLARAMGAQARECVARQFDFARYIDGLEALFNQVMEETQCLADA